MTVEVPNVDPKGALDFFKQKMTYTTGPVELARMLEQNMSVHVVDAR